MVRAPHPQLPREPVMRSHGQQIARWSDTAGGGDSTRSTGFSPAFAPAPPPSRQLGAGDFDLPCRMRRLWAALDCFVETSRSSVTGLTKRSFSSSSLSGSKSGNESTKQILALRRAEWK